MGCLEICGYEGLSLIVMTVSKPSKVTELSADELAQASESVANLGLMTREAHATIAAHVSARWDLNTAPLTNVVRLGVGFQRMRFEYAKKELFADRITRALLQRKADLAKKNLFAKALQAVGLMGTRATQMWVLQSAGRCCTIFAF